MSVEINTIMTIFAYLPTEIIEYILSYDGLYKNRNGCFIKQISNDDSRYKLFDNVPKPTISIVNRKSYIYVDIKIRFEGYRTISIDCIHNDISTNLLLYHYNKLLYGDPDAGFQTFTIL